MKNEQNIINVALYREHFVTGELFVHFSFCVPVKLCILCPHLNFIYPFDILEMNVWIH